MEETRMKQLVVRRAKAKAIVQARKRVLGVYIPIPCIKDFGSCDYEDLCVYGITPEEECPPILQEHDVPCRCPIEKGTYKFPAGQFLVPRTRWAGIMAGTYKAKVRFESNGNFINCYNFKAILDAHEEN